MRRSFITCFKPGFNLLVVITGLLAVSFLNLNAAWGDRNQPKKSPKSSTKATSQNLLSNDDIIKLVKSEFDEDFIITKINHEKEVGFNLDVDGLIYLKENGVSKNLIFAMMNKVSPFPKEIKPVSAPAPSLSPPKSPSPSQVNQPVKTSTTQAVSMVDKIVGQNVSTVKLVTKTGEIELEGKIGRAQFSIFKAEANYPGLKAKTRITDLSPSFVISLPHEPPGQVFIVRLEQEKDDNIRVMKCGATLFRLSTKGLGLPDEDLRIPFDYKTEGKDIYRLTLKKDLANGEYGVYVLAASAIEAGMLHDFGVD